MRNVGLLPRSGGAWGGGIIPGIVPTGPIPGGREDNPGRAVGIAA